MYMYYCICTKRFTNWLSEKEKRINKKNNLKFYTHSKIGTRKL